MTVEERIEKEKEIKRHKRNARYTLFAGIALVFIVPYLLTNLPFIKCTDTATTGQIGDTVGGLTSPIVNLISAILIYLSFQQQLVANEIQISMLDHEKGNDKIKDEKESLLFHYSEIKDSISAFKFRSLWSKTQGDYVFYGVDALETFIKDYKQKLDINQSSAYYSVNLILLDVEIFVDAVTSSEFLNDADKEYFLFRMHNLFFQRLTIPLDGIADIEKASDKKNISELIQTIRTKLGVPPNS